MRRRTRAAVAAVLLMVAGGAATGAEAQTRAKDAPVRRVAPRATTEARPVVSRGVNLMEEEQRRQERARKYTRRGHRDYYDDAYGWYDQYGRYHRRDVIVERDIIIVVPSATATTTTNSGSVRTYTATGLRTYVAGSSTPVGAAPSPNVTPVRPNVTPIGQQQR